MAETPSIPTRLSVQLARAASDAALLEQDHQTLQADNERIRQSNLELSERVTDLEAKLAAPSPPPPPAITPPPPPTPATVSRRIFIGQNLEPRTEHGYDAAFARLDRSMAPWGHVNEPGKRELPQPKLDERGNPLEPAGSYSRLRHHPAGPYKVWKEGSGTLSFSGKGASFDKSLGLLTIDPSLDQDLFLRVRDVNPADPPRNISIQLQGAAGVLSPGFERLASGWHCLRFMDWQRTNLSPIRSWADRVLPTDFVQTGPRGVALELMIDTCLQTRTPGWWCIPDLADDDFIVQFCTLIQNRLLGSTSALAPIFPGCNSWAHCPVYLEWGNETWNTDRRFSGPRIRAAAQDTQVFPDVGADESLNYARYIAYKNARTSTIARQILGPNLVFIYGAHYGGQWQCEEGLKYVQQKFPAGPSALFDALAITYYFDYQPEFEAEVIPPGEPGFSADPSKPAYRQIPRSAAEFSGHLAARTTENWKTIREYKARALRFGIKRGLWAYEGGDHGNNRNRLLNRTAHSPEKEASKISPFHAGFTGNWVCGARRQFSPGAMVCHYMLTSPQWGVAPTVEDDKHPKVLAMRSAMT